MCYFDHSFQLDYINKKYFEINCMMFGYIY